MENRQTKLVVSLNQSAQTWVQFPPSPQKEKLSFGGVFLFLLEWELKAGVATGD